jgi:LacI family transcriptional regulator
VAREAGVSKALVSRYINAKAGVSQKSKVKIRRAIDRLRYPLPETQLQKVITVMISGVSLFHRELLLGCSAAARAEGYVLTIAGCFDDAFMKETTARLLSQGGARGVVVYGSSMSDKGMIDLFIKNGMPLALIENDIPEGNVEKILIDNYQGQFSITERVIRRGFRDIRMIPWDLASRAGIERMAGFLAALRESGLPTGNNYVYPPEKPGFEGVFEILKKLAGLHSLPEVFVCGGDSLAAYAVLSCMKLGIRVPQDLSVTGFDGWLGADFGASIPALTTVRQPLYEMGEFAVKRLLKIIANPGETPGKTLFHTEFVPGETLGPGRAED